VWMVCLSAVVLVAGASCPYRALKPSTMTTMVAAPELSASTHLIYRVYCCIVLYKKLEYMFLSDDKIYARVTTENAPGHAVMRP
jgi:hypothetical protein